VRLVRKPWGSTSLRPWSANSRDGEAIGKLWFQRIDTSAPATALLFKRLFLTEKLSIQVHSDNVYARSPGMPHGKTEAWYVLSATPDAKVAVGLNTRMATQQLRVTIEDGSIADAVKWHRIRAGDAVFVPAGTIHAIGPVLVIADIQQSSDATFRTFDYGCRREHHVADAVAVADAGPAGAQVALRRRSEVRTLLIACPYFVLERIDLSANSGWEVEAGGETWLLALEGNAQIGAVHATAGAAFFLAADHVAIETDRVGLSALVAYVAAEPLTGLLAGPSPKQSMEARS